MLKNEPINTIIEKYCHVVGHNVVVEVTCCGYMEIKSKCLESHNCEQERGGCTNKYLIKKKETAKKHNVLTFIFAATPYFIRKL